MAKKSETRRTVELLIGLAIVYGFGYICPSFGGITELGMKCLGVMIGLIYMVCVGCDMLIASMFSLLAFVVHGYYTTATLLSNWLGTTTVFQLVFCGGLCLTLRESGAMNVIAKKMLTSKIAKGKPAMLVGMVLLCGFIVSIFLGGAGYFLLFYGLVDSICDVCGYGIESDVKKLMLLGLYVGHYGSTLLPFKGVLLSTIGIFNGALEAYNYKFSEVQFIVLNLITWLGLVVLYVLTMKFIFRTDMSKLAALDVDKIPIFKETPDKFNKNMKISLYSILFCLAYVLITMFLPKTFPGYKGITILGSSLIWCVPVIVFGFIHDKNTGKPYFNLNKLLKESSLWNMIALVGAMTILGKVCTDANLGIGSWITSIMTPIFGDMPLPLLMLALVVVVTLVTQVVNGQPLTMALGPVVATLVCTAIQNGQTGNPTIFLGTVSNCATVAYMTVAGSNAAAYLLNREEIDQKFLWTKGLVVIFVYIIWQFVASMLCNYMFPVTL